FEGESELAVVTIPSNNIPRFRKIEKGDKTYIVFIDDILRQNIKYVFQDRKVSGFYSFKVTRDAELNLDDEFEGDLREKIERQIAKRDYGLASRLLYQPDTPDIILKSLLSLLKLQKQSAMVGGYYHILNDFFKVPIDNKEWDYRPQPPLTYNLSNAGSLFERLEQQDTL